MLGTQDDRLRVNPLRYGVTPSPFFKSLFKTFYRCWKFHLQVINSLTILSIKRQIFDTWLGVLNHYWALLMIQLALIYQCANSHQQRFFLKKWPSSASFSFIFVLFKQTLQFLQQIYMKNVHPVDTAGIWTYDLRNMSLLP